MTLAKTELKQWAKTHLRGVQNLLMPSFTPDLAELDEDGIRWDVQQSIRHGFFSMNCTTQVGLSFDEAVRFVKIAVSEARGRIQVSPIADFDTLEQNLAFVQEAERVGCDTVLLAYPPNFRPQSPEELIAVTQKICDATRLPVILYASHKWNFGRFHPSGFALDALSRLIEIENVVAVLCALIEPGFVFECFRRCQDQVLVQCPWERWVPLLTVQCGQQWFGPGAYELFQSPDNPYLINYHNLLLQGQINKAMAIYWQLTPVRHVFEKQFMPTQMIGLYNWPQQKYYQWLVGGNGGFTRQPVMRLYQHEMDEARNILRAIGITPRENDDEFYVGRMNYDKGFRPGGDSQP